MEYGKEDFFNLEFLRALKAPSRICSVRSFLCIKERQNNGGHS